MSGSLLGAVFVHSISSTAEGVLMIPMQKRAEAGCRVNCCAVFHLHGSSSC